MRWLFAWASALMLAGCISQTAGLTVKERDLPWRVGVTTRRDVVSQWGNPDSRRERPWIWKGVRGVGGKFKLGYMGVGFTLSNVKASSVSCEMTFDAEGRLEKMQLVDSVARRPKWSVDPF